MMAGEKKIEKSEPLDTGLKSDPYTALADQEAASGKDGMPSDSTLSISSSGDGPTVKDATDQESVAEQGVYYPPSTCYNYYYPGYSGACTQLDDRGYLHADGSYTGVQSDNGSLVYYLPGYNPYATGNLMGVDGQCINQQPYFSSSGYLQHPVSYGSEAGPCYSWDSTFVGDAPNGTGASLGNSKSGSGPTASAKSNGFNSMKTNGMIAGKFSTLPVDSKSRQVAATSNFSKSIHQTPPHKSFNKVPQLGSDFTGGIVKGGFHPVLKFPSFMNQKQGLFPYNDALNHRSNGRTWNGNDRFKLREKSNGNAEFEASTELTCGPRACNRSALVNSADEKEVLGFTVRRDQYNLQDFPTEYEIAKFYVIKSYNEDNIHRCVKYDVWSSTPNGNKKLDAAFHDAEVKASETGKNCPIFLFFSVNGSGQFVGLAEMIGPVDFNKDMDFWQLDKWSGFFPVKWHIIKDIPNSQLRHIILEDNDNRPVTYTRDTQEIGPKQGLEMLNIFKSHSSKSSILDDFNFYENREKSLIGKKCSKPASPQTELFENGDYPKHLKASGERKIVEESAKTKRSSNPMPSLINITQNLSLNARPLKSSSAVTNPREKSMPSVSTQTEF